MIPASLTSLSNHLWQSSLFALAAALLALAFRRSHARVRYWLWLAASLKFLVPFLLLVGLGNQFGWRTGALVARPQLTFVMDQIGQPFAESAPAPVSSAPRTPAGGVPAVVLGVWLCGFAAVVLAWSRQWWRIRAAVQAGRPMHLDIPIQAVSSPARLEPGVFGILRPVLLLPQGIADRLTPAQLRAVIAHELCHVRRRDNLAAALHMLVEALFWFHPLVWWIGARLVEERERACDEEVLCAAEEPQVYAEGILNVCKFYLESRVPCVSGVTGSNLKRRIHEIMTHRGTRDLSAPEKLLLCVAGMLSVAAPIFVGILNAPPVRAQSAPDAALAFEAASVKPNKSPEFRGGVQFLPGRFRAQNLPVYWVIAAAYNIGPQSVRLSGGPEWIRSEKYDIEATAGSGAMPAGLSAKAREDRVRRMLQTLLADRFRLTVRRETRDLPAYVVVVAKNGLKLQKASIDEKDCSDAPAAGGIRCHVINGGMGRGLHGKAVTISDITGFVENWSDRPMVDGTGIPGLFEVESDGWTPMRPPPPPPPGTPPNPEAIALADPARPTLFMIFDRLGLKVESQKAPVEMLVIDHVERPAEN